MAADLLETLRAHKDGCVGMAANMIGVNKRIIAFDDEGAYLVHVQPGDRKENPAPMTHRRGLPLPHRHPSGPSGGRSIKVRWQNEQFQAAVEDLHRLDCPDHPA